MGGRTGQSGCEGSVSRSGKEKEEGTENDDKEKMDKEAELTEKK